MTGPRTEKLAVLFADISGSTALYDKLGDKLARQLVAECLEVMIRQAAAHQGTLIKTIGDEILCTFPTPAAALEAACAMQATIENCPPKASHPMHIRIGFHYGDVICEAGDVFGDTVNIAARVAAITRARQIITTRAATEALSTGLRKKVRQTRRAEFRGKQEALDIFLVGWEEDDVMATRIGLPAFRKPNDARIEILLRHHRQVVTVNEQRRSAVLGRSEECDIVARTALASRQHARIELSFGKFMLVDHSANGTYIRLGDGQVIHLAHEEIALHGAGAISLGEAFSEDPAELIEFIVQ